MLLLIVVVAFLAGVGITAIGPGGIFITIALSMTPLSPALIAGTGSATNVVAGTIGSGMYAQSGELRSGSGKRLTVVLSLCSVAGALAGQWLNGHVSKPEFMAVLGGVLLVTGLLTWYRVRYDSGVLDISLDTTRGLAIVAILGVFVGIPGGLLGVGGPVLAVPLLVAVGVPLLSGVAAAQVQSVFIAAPAAIAYLLEGAISLPLVALFVIPEIAGLYVGWKIAHQIDAGRLKLVLAGTLILLTPYFFL
ncbi:sulfite exporter TauE/SafE family protein [Natronomonas salina]|nr:sulfite exporter TauE/SafE family protein [Natronomonas salina]